MSDFGADVIKVEPPGQGDTQRLLYRLPPLPVARGNYAWHLSNRNKRGVALDLKSPSAVPVLRRLVEWADVLITNYPHGTREKLHLGYDEVSAWNPRLIYADLTGFGDAGPDAGLPGFDVTAYWARTGLLAETRDAGAPPTVSVYGSGDQMTAIGLYAAIVTALYRRERTGLGANVGTSLLAEGVWSAATPLAGALAGGKPYGLHDRTKPSNPLINPYQTGDGRWFMLVAQPRHWPTLATMIGHPELLTDPRFADRAEFAKNTGVLADVLDIAFRSQPFAHWKEQLDIEEITYSLIQSTEEAAHDPQLRAAGIVVPIEGADDLEWTVNSPFTLRGVPKVPARRGPELGEHTDEVLAQLGFSEDDIDKLRADGAVPTTAHLETAS
jgi:formyl-CoA transferase